MPSVSAIVLGGDFNTNKDQPLFISERTLDVIQETGFANVYERLPLPTRVTHPGKGRYPDATFDYLFSKNLNQVGKPTMIESAISDHRPVTCDFEIPFSPHEPPLPK
jgi:endonuclease/exonuclease/phosphatase (EEP) superfamily protein YafD